MSGTTSRTGPLGLLSTSGEHARLQFERTYPTTPADLWEAVTDPQRLSRWLGTVTRDGDQYRIVLGDGADEWAEGELVDCWAPHAYTVTWDYPGESGSRVTVTVTAGQEPGAACLALVQEDLSAEQGAGYGAGWHAYLDRLDAHVDGRPLPEWESVFEARLGAYRSQL